MSNQGNQPKMTSFIRQVGEFSHIYLNLASLSSSWWGAQWKAVYQPGSARERRQDSWCAVVQWGGKSKSGLVQKWGMSPVHKWRDGFEKLPLNIWEKSADKPKFFFGGSPCSDKPMGAQQHGSFQALVQVMVRNARLEECMKRMLGRWFAWCWLESNTREIQSVLLPHGEHWSKSIANDYIFVLSWSNLGLQHDCYYTYAICQVQTCRVEWAFPRCTNVRWFGSSLGDVFSSHRKGLRVHAARRHHWIHPPDHVWFSVQRSPSSWTFKVSNCTSSRRPWVTLTSSKRILPVLSLARVVLSLACIAEPAWQSVESILVNLQVLSSWIFCVHQHGPSGFQFWKLFYVFCALRFQTHLYRQKKRIEKTYAVLTRKWMDFDVPWSRKTSCSGTTQRLWSCWRKPQAPVVTVWWETTRVALVLGPGALLFLPPAFLDLSQAYHLRRWHIIHI